MESELNETACSKSLHLPRSILLFFPVFFGFRPWEPRRRLERSVRVNHGRRTQNSWTILIVLWHLSSAALPHSVKLYFCTSRVPVLMLLFWACRPFGLFLGSEPMTQINILTVFFFFFLLVKFSLFRWRMITYSKWEKSPLGKEKSIGKEKKDFESWHWR